MTDLSIYRPNVGVALFNASGALWMGRRIYFDEADPEMVKADGRWQMPQGGVDPGEEFGAAAFRELEEETGVKAAELITVTPGWLTYEFPNGKKKNGHVGQRQKWAAMLFRGDDADIALDRHEPEFDAWRWAELEDASTLITPFKREVYGEVVAAFRPIRDLIRKGVIS